MNTFKSLLCLREEGAGAGEGGVQEPSFILQALLPNEIWGDLFATIQKLLLTPHISQRRDLYPAYVV